MCARLALKRLGRTLAVKLIGVVGIARLPTRHNLLGSSSRWTAHNLLGRARCNPTQSPLDHACLQHGHARLVFTDIAQQHRFQTGRTAPESVSAQKVLVVKDVSSRLSKHYSATLTPSNMAVFGHETVALNGSRNSESHPEILICTKAKPWRLLSQAKSAPLAQSDCHHREKSAPSSTDSVRERRLFALD